MRLIPNGKAEYLAYVVYIVFLFFGLFVRHNDVVLLAGIGICFTISHSYNRLEIELKRRFESDRDERLVARITNRLWGRLRLDGRDPIESPPKRYLQ